jgi:hypothetical protein
MYLLGKQEVGKIESSSPLQGTDTSCRRKITYGFSSARVSAAGVTVIRGSATVPVML